MDSPVSLSFKESIRTALDKRLGTLLETPSNAVKTTCLDPRHSRDMKDFLGDDLWNECWEAIIEDGVCLYPQEEQDQARDDAKHYLARVQAMLAHSNLKPEDDASSILTFWRSLNKDGPSFFKGAVRCVMCIPGGAGLAESTFSHTTRDVTKTRNLLGDDTLEQLTVIQSYLINDDSYSFDNFFSQIKARVQRAMDEADETKRAPK